MNKITDSGHQKIPKNFQAYDLFLTEHEKSIFDLDFNEAQMNIIILDDDSVHKLLDFLLKRMVVIELIEKMKKESMVTKQRISSLKETQEIVSSLQEIDNTSTNALNFLKEKIDLLLTEKEDLLIESLKFKEEVSKISEEESLIGAIRNFVANVDFIDTASWEEELDYFRNRFLMQQEQKEDQSLKEQFVVRDVSEGQEVVRQELNQSHPNQQLAIVKIAFQRRRQKELEKTIQMFNVKQKELESLLTNLTPQSEEDIEKLLEEQEKKSFEIGKQIYILKRVQGILTLKTYEIIQTVKSRLLNISGFSAAQKFTKNTLTELLELSQSHLPFIEKKQAIFKTMDRLLKMLKE